MPHAIGTLFSACPQVSDRTIPTNAAFATLPVNGMACQKQSQHCPFLGGPEQKNNKIHVAFKSAASQLLGGISRGDRLDRLRENKKKDMLFLSFLLFVDGRGDHPPNSPKYPMFSRILLSTRIWSKIVICERIEKLY